MSMDTRRNPDGSLTVGIIEDVIPKKEKPVEKEEPKTEPKTEPKATKPRTTTTRRKK